MLDLIIIGAGPSGLSAAYAAAQCGLDYLVLEKGLLAHTIYRYPVGRTVFSTPNELEMTPGALQPLGEKPTREELLSHYVNFALSNDLQIQTEECVTEVNGDIAQGFTVTTEKQHYRARRILFAVGAMAYPRRLNVSGEDLPKVHHRFTEPYPFVKKRAMVVGGGNSAAEAALFLAVEGAFTTLVIWPQDWANRDAGKGAIKHWVRTPLEAEIVAGHLEVVCYSHVVSIETDAVTLVRDDGETMRLQNDVVFILTGADADLSLLTRLGVLSECVGQTHFPVYNEDNFETNVAGVYVTGHFTRSRHINLAIAIPKRVVPLIAASLRAGARA